MLHSNTPPFLWSSLDNVQAHMTPDACSRIYQTNVSTTPLYWSGANPISKRVCTTRGHSEPPSRSASHGGQRRAGQASLRLCLQAHVKTGVAVMLDASAAR